MESTIIEYLEQQRAPFSDVPFCEVDSLVLSTIAYFNFEKGKLGRTVPTDIVPLPVAICGVAPDDLFGGIWLSRMGGGEFLATLLTSSRFMDLYVGFYVNEVSAHFEKQFAAVTFFFPDGTVYVAFRGTDNSLAGWKEDFNLTFMNEVPSQVSARTYLEDIAETNPLHLYVGGHSKGGNLAEYAALTCRECTFQKVEQIYNHDGPGFAFLPNERIDTPAYRAKLQKTVPESSVFGMLMETRDCFRAVRSSGVLFAQHATTHWTVKDNRFITVDSITSNAAIISGTLNKWARKYEPDERARFIDAVYDVLCAAGVDTWSEFAEDRSSNALAVFEATMRLPADMRATIFSMLRDMGPIIGAETAKQARDRMPSK